MHKQTGIEINTCLRIKWATDIWLAINQTDSMRTFEHSWLRVKSVHEGLGIFIK